MFPFICVKYQSAFTEAEKFKLHSKKAFKEKLRNSALRLYFIAFGRKIKPGAQYFPRFVNNNQTTRVGYYPLITVFHRI